MAYVLACTVPRCDSQVPSKETIMGRLGQEKATTTPTALAGYETGGARTVSCGMDVSALGEPAKGLEREAFTSVGEAGGGSRVSVLLARFIQLVCL